MEVLLEPICPYGAKVGAKQLRKPPVLRLRQPLLALEQYPTRFGQGHSVPALPQLASFDTSDLVDSVVKKLNNVETVEHMHSRAGSFCNDMKEPSPHVARNKLDGLGARLAKPVEEALECCRGAVAADPEEALTAVVDLVDDGEELVALLPADFVNTDGPNAVEILVSSAPLDGVAHCFEDHMPAGPEAPGRLRPAQRLGPTRQEPTVCRRDGRLAHRPGHRLDHNSAARTIDPTRGVGETHGDVP